MSENIKQNLKSGFISAFFNLGPSSKVKHAVVCARLGAGASAAQQAVKAAGLCWTLCSGAAPFAVGR